MVLAISYLAIGLLAFTGQAARINPMRRQAVQDVAGIPGLPQPNMVVNQNHDIYTVLPIPTIDHPVQQGAVEKHEHFLETRAADAEAAESIEARRLTFPKLKSPRSSPISNREPYGTKVIPSCFTTNTRSNFLTVLPKLPQILGHSPFQAQPRGELNDVVGDFTDALISNGPAIHLVDPPIVNVADISVVDPFTQWLDSIAVYEEIARAQHLPSTTVTFTLTLDAIVTEIVPPPIIVTETPLVTLTFTFAQLPTLPAMGPLSTSALPAAAGILPAMPTVTGLPALPIAAPTGLEGVDPFVPSVPTVAGLPAASVPTLPADLQQGGQEVPAVAAATFIPSIPTVAGIPAASVPTLPADLQQGGQEVPDVAAATFVPSIPTVAGLPAASVPTLPADLQQGGQEVPDVAAATFVPSIPTVAGIPAASVPTLPADLQQGGQEAPAMVAIPEVPDNSVPTPAANPDQLSPFMDSIPSDADPSIPESISTPTLPAAVSDVFNVATTLPSTPEFAAPTTLLVETSDIFNVATILPVEPQIPAAAPTLPAVVDDASDIFNVATTIPTGFLTLPSPALQTDIPTSLPDSLAFNGMNPDPVIPTFASPNSENANNGLPSADLPSIPSPENITPSTSSAFNPTNLVPTSLDPSAAVPDNCLGQTPGSSCANNEGAWHCFCDGTSFQRCGSGVWSNVLHVASGATCEPGYFNNRLIMYISATGSVERVGGGKRRRGSGGRGGVMVRRTRVEVEAEV